MAHTLEELESLLEGRALVGRVLHQVPGTEPGADYVITDVDYFPLSRIVEMRTDAGRCTFTLKDVEKLLDGQKVGGMGKWQNKAYTLLPAEEGEEPAKAEIPKLITEYDCFMSAVPKAEEPTGQSKPAKPALTHDWQKRWWQFYYHFITADETSAEEAASMADEAITVARKHLEGEA